MRIDKSLNLVVPVETEAGTLYVHSAPIRVETFKCHFLVLSKTLSAMYEEGIGRSLGPRVASLMLQKIAAETGVWGGETGVENSLLAEIRRLSNVIVPTASGWQSLPLVDAAKQGHLTALEVEEAEGFIVFFTCIYHLHKRKDLHSFMAPMSTLWDTESTSLSSTEYRDSLPILTETETFAPTVPQSSVPG